MVTNLDVIWEGLWEIYEGIESDSKRRVKDELLQRGERAMAVCSLKFFSSFQLKAWCTILYGGHNCTFVISQKLLGVIG